MSPPGSFDGLQFSRDMGELRGRLGIAQLPRLVESGVQTDGIDYFLGGGSNSQGKPSLRITARGRMGLPCQRCLEPLGFDLAVDVELELCADAREIAAAEDDVDRVLAGPAMQLAELVEDEVLLAIPAAPKHENCELAVKNGPAEKDSPFGALRALAGKRKN